MRLPKQLKFSEQGGFSLVELMIVVGIIGILATLAMPRFRQFQAKAKMGEAKNNLTHIYTLQQSYQLNNGNVNCNAPVNAQEIGFEISPCTDNAAPVPRYGYQVVNSTRSVFQAEARYGTDQGNLICPGEPAHGFSMTQDKVFSAMFPSSRAAQTPCSA